MATLEYDDEKPAGQIQYDAPARSWWDTAKSIGQTADDAVRAAANAVTFGMADRLAGYATPGSSVDEQVRLSQEARARSPIASTTGEIAGSVAIPGMGGARLATGIGSRVAPGAISQFGARALGYGAEGAGIGALQGAGNTYTGIPQDYVNNALMGGVFGGVTGGLVGGALGPRGMVSSAERPTLQEQQTFTNLAYDRLRRNATQYEPPAFSNAADDVAQRLMNMGHVPDYRPTTWNAIDRMRNMQDVTPASIDVIRQGLNRIPKTDAAAADRAAAREVKRALDDFVANPPAGAVRPGVPPQAAAEAAELGRIARDSRAAQGRMEMIEGVREKAALDAAATASGRNKDNLIRQNTKNYFLNPLNNAAQARLAAYNPAERAALANIPDPPGWRTNAIRMIGNMGGGGGGVATPLIAATAGGGVGAFMGDDSVTGALKGASIAGGGLAARSLANRMGRGRIEAAENLIRERSPIYQNRVANAPMVPTGPLSPRSARQVRDAITLQLLEAEGIPRITVRASDPVIAGE